jgi:DNA invertase Pin-like site-specific DNA recombinase
MAKHTPKPSASLPSQKRAVIWKAVSSRPQAEEEKVSLPEQERLAREWCEANGYDVVRILEVPGYSRRESDVVSVLEDYAEQGIYAYHDLRKMWQNHDFDVLVAYSHDRLGRSNTLHSWVMECIVMYGMQLFLIADGGFVDLEDFRYKLAIGGMMAATPIDRLVRASAAAKDKLTMQGLPIGGMIPISHKRVRDTQSGKTLRLELNEDMLPLFDNLATLLLEGVAYNFLSEELYRRYGHLAPDGKLYRHNQFFDLLYTPAFWGHMAKGYSTASNNGNMRGAWVFDETVPAPAGVVVARNVVPAVYTGELAEAIKAEIYRRMAMTGNRKPDDTYRFSGLFICGVCGSGMSAKSKPGYGRRGLICSRSFSRTVEKNCTENKLVTHKYLQSEMDRLLRQLVEGTTPDIFKAEKQEDDALQRLNALRGQIQNLEQRLATLINEQSSAPNAARPIYRQQIERLSEQYERLNEESLTLQRKIEEEAYVTREEIRTIDDLRKLTLECFWKLPDREINQWLLRLMGKRKFVIINKQIVDVALPMPQKRANAWSRRRPKSTLE